MNEQEFSGRFSIGNVAKLADVGVETIRFYEREGIISQPKKLMGSVRTYPRETIKRLHFIKRAQELGFSLQEIMELLAIRAKGKNTCSTMRDRAEKKIAQIERKIEDLRKIQTALLDVTDCCAKQAAAETCPVLEGFYA